MKSLFILLSDRIKEGYPPTVSYCSLTLLLSCVFQSAQNLAQISDLQAQLEEALKEKQEVQEKVDAGFLLLSYH